LHRDCAAIDPAECQTRRGASQELNQST
jgi:hypothetical protein